MRTSSENGFTLIELLVTMLVATVVLGATVAAFTTFQTDDVYAQRRNETQDAARTAVNRLARQLRNVVAPSSEYAGALEAISTEGTSIRFQTVNTSSYESGENSARAMRVRYCLNDSKPENEVLWEQTQEWKKSTTPSVPAETNCPETVSSTHEEDWTTKRQVVNHITNYIGGNNRPVFSSSTIEVPLIVTVKTDLFLNVNPGHRPGESQLASTVSLRDATRKPVAKFTATPEAGHDRYRLNASESYDLDGLALTYKWWQKEGSGSETELSTTSQIYETGELKSKTSYTFKLQVTNPGGLSETAKETVTTP